MNKPTKIVAPLLAAALVAVSCGSDDQLTTADPADRGSTQTADDTTSEPGGARRTLAPQLLVRHGELREWETAVYVDEEDRKALIERFEETVADFEAADEAGFAAGEALATDPAEIEGIDLAENFIVTGGYYCDDGGLRLEVGPTELVVHVHDNLDCDAPQPVSSIFVVPREATSGTFTLRTEEGGTDVGRVVTVDDWAVTGNG